MEDTVLIECQSREHGNGGGASLRQLRGQPTVRQELLCRVSDENQFGQS